MQVIYDFWCKFFCNDAPKTSPKKQQPVIISPKPIPMTDNPPMDIKSTSKQKAPKNPIFQIQRQQINENSFIDIIDGEKYVVEYGQETINITHPNGSKKAINLNQLMQSSTFEEREKMIQYFKEQNAGILSDLASEAGYIHYFPEGYNIEGKYLPKFEELQISPKSCTHELMHALDNYNNTCNDWEFFSGRPEYIKTVREEFSAFSKSNDKFLNEANGDELEVDNTAEIFAECAALITSGGKHSHNEEVIKKYFPKTLMLTRKYIDEARELPQTERMGAKYSIKENVDGSIDYTRLRQNNLPITTVRFDRKLWPYTQPPYYAQYDENGVLVKETNNEIIGGNIADQTVITFDPKTKTKTIKTIDVDPCTDKTKSITEETIKQDPFSRNINTRYYKNNKLTKEINKKISKDESEIDEEEIFYDSNREPTKTIQKKYNFKTNYFSIKEKSKNE